MDPGPCPYQVGDAIELGDRVRLVMVGLYGESGVFGGVLSHDRPDGTRCSGSVHWDVVGQKMKTVWKVESWEPLTCTPSFGCHCGFHGFIRGGRWVSA